MNASKSFTKTLSLLITAILTTATIPAFSEVKEEKAEVLTEKKADKGLSMDEIEIEANEMSVDYEKGIAIFAGNVSTVGDQMNMTCERLEITFSQKDQKIIAFTATSTTDRIKITVNDTKGSSSEASGEKAVYNEKEGLLILTGKPVITNGNMLLSNMGKATATIKNGEINKFKAEKDPALGRIKMKFTKKKDPVKETK